MNPNQPIPKLSIRFKNWSVRPDHPEGIAFGSKITVTVVFVAHKTTYYDLLFCRHGVRVSGRVIPSNTVFHYEELAKDITLKANREYTYTYTFRVAEQSPYAGELLTCQPYVEAAAVIPREWIWSKSTKNVTLREQDESRWETINAQHPTGYRYTPERRYIKAPKSDQYVLLFAAAVALVAAYFFEDRRNISFPISIGATLVLFGVFWWKASRPAIGKIGLQIEQSSVHQVQLHLDLSEFKPPQNATPTISLGTFETVEDRDRNPSSDSSWTINTAFANSTPQLPIPVQERPQLPLTIDLANAESVQVIDLPHVKVRPGIELRLLVAGKPYSYYWPLELTAYGGAGRTVYGN